jgi:hypothetical protein
MDKEHGINVLLPENMNLFVEVIVDYCLTQAFT